MNNKPTILIVDDEPNLRASLKMILMDKYNVMESGAGKDALNKVKKHLIDLVLLDIRLPELSGLDILARIKEIDESIDVIMLTAVNTVDTAVEAIKKGAYDFITKPFDVDKLESIIDRLFEKRNLVRENLYLRYEASRGSQFKEIIGKSSIMKDIFQMIDTIAKSSSTVIIYGDSGTGKELAARAIHKRSDRGKNFFVPVNCAAIPENLIESELFGHEKGSFTGAYERHIGKFELADKGTLFLDEIGSLPIGMQTKLLRAIQEKEIERIGGTKPIPTDVRIICATNIDLKDAISKRLFREDLFYRLNVVPITLPPLRDRKEDIPLLVEYFIEKYNKEFGKSIAGISKDSMDILINYKWRGNVRELENLIERIAVLSSPKEIIQPNHLPPEITGDITNLENEYEGLTFKQACDKFESRFIKTIIEKAGGNKSKAAGMLGIHRNTLLQLEKKASAHKNMR